METTAREFARNFKRLRAVAARGKTVRVTAPEGIYLFTLEKPKKTCGEVLTALARYDGKGFLSTAGARAIEASKHRPVVATSPWDAP